MAIRNIVTKEDSSLRKVSRPITTFDARLHTLLDDMRETLYEADGAGLAAVQVGVLRRAVLVHVDEELLELINPEIIATEGEQCAPEGCLSVPGIWGTVKRPFSVTVRAQDRNGKEFTVCGEGFRAQAFCHEIDHLNGTLFIDKVEEYLERA